MPIRRRTGEGQAARGKAAQTARDKADDKLSEITTGARKEVSQGITPVNHAELKAFRDKDPNKQ